MEISINNSNVDNKDNSNTKEYLENDNSNFSEINIITNENNNNGEKRNRNRNKFKNEIEKLNNNKSNESNDLNDEFTIPPELHKTFIMTSILKYFILFIYQIRFKLMKIKDMTKE